MKKAILSLLLINSSINGDEVIVRTPSGNSITMEIEPNTAFNTVIGEIEGQIATIEAEPQPNHYFIDYAATPKPLSSQQSRDYYRLFNAKQKEKLSYMLKTLATASLPKLLTVNGDLKKAGAEVDPLHPLRFWAEIFLSNENKGYIHAIRDRSKVWKEFMSGCEKSLEQEWNANNIKPEYISDFSSSLKIDRNAISNAIQQKRWEKFVEILITSIPRSGDTSRYDM